MTRLWTVAVCIGAVFTAPSMLLARDWITIDMAAVCVDGKLTILRSHHDSAVVGVDDRIEWNLDCLNCPEKGGTGPEKFDHTCGGSTVEYWIQSVEFAADLDNAAEILTTGGQLGKSSKMRKHHASGLMNPGKFVGKNGSDRKQQATKRSNGKKLESDVLTNVSGEFPVDLNELWKFTVVVATQASGLDENTFSTEACELLPGCDYWDPHIYVHGDGKPGR